MARLSLGPARCALRVGSRSGCWLGRGPCNAASPWTSGKEGDPRPLLSLPQRERRVWAWGGRGRASGHLPTPPPSSTASMEMNESSRWTEEEMETAKKGGPCAWRSGAGGLGAAAAHQVARQLCHGSAAAAALWTGWQQTWASQGRSELAGGLQGHGSVGFAGLWTRRVWAAVSHPTPTLDPGAEAEGGSEPWSWRLGTAAQARHCLGAARWASAEGPVSAGSAAGSPGGSPALTCHLARLPGAGAGARVPEAAQWRPQSREDPPQPPPSWDRCPFLLAESGLLQSPRWAWRAAGTRLRPASSPSWLCQGQSGAGRAWVLALLGGHVEEVLPPWRAPCRSSRPLSASAVTLKRLLVVWPSPP